MRLSNIFATVASVVCLPLFVAAEHTHMNAKRHDGLAKRMASNQTESHGFAKRDVHQGILTWYPTGLGACGITNHDNDFIVAVSESVYFSSGKYPADVCFKTVTIQWQGKSTGATVVDGCQNCDGNHLDASPGLMHFFAQEDELDNITWWFDGEGPASSSAAPPPPSSTSTRQSSSTPPVPSSTKSSTSSSHSSTSTSHSTSHSSSSTTSAPPTSTATSTPTPSPTQTSAVQMVDQAFLGLAAIAAVGAAN